MPDSGARSTGFILSGGVALGAYQAGALARFLETPAIEATAIAGSSIGALNGAIIAGNRPERRLEAMQAFWDAVVSDRARAWLDPFRIGEAVLGRHLNSWLNAGAVKLAGNEALFRPRGLAEPHPSHVPSLYIAERTRDAIERHVDFALLNAGEVRFCCAATDIESGESVVFDTAAGDAITPDHLMASCSLVPEFPPVSLGGRLLADGGFAANAPLEPLLASDRIEDAPPLCILIDLFPAASPPPRSLDRAVERAADLKYACQTELRLAAIGRERLLELELPSRSERPGTDLLCLAYPALADESGPAKTWDFSGATLRRRWEEGAAAAAMAIDMLPAPNASPGLRLHRATWREG